MIANLLRLALKPARRAADGPPPERREQGDTIVEVLMAIAVVSLVLGITFSSMNKGLLRMHDTKERTEAFKLLEGQIEALKFSSGGSTLGIPAVGSNAFCIDTAGAPAVQTFKTSGIPSADISADDFDAYPAQCVHDHYRLAIKRESARNFRFYVRWDKIGSHTTAERNQVEMVYRTQ